MAWPRASADDAALDADHDGMTNLQEYLAGTDPQDAASRFTNAITLDGGVPSVRFIARAGRGYTVQFSDTLGSWSKLADVAPQAVTAEVAVADPSAVGRTETFLPHPHSAPTLNPSMKSWSRIVSSRLSRCLPAAHAAITVSGVADKTKYDNSVTVTITADPNAATTTATLDGAPFAVGSGGGGELGPLSRTEGGEPRRGKRAGGLENGAFHRAEFRPQRLGGRHSHAHALSHGE